MRSCEFLETSAVDNWMSAREKVEQLFADSRVDVYRYLILLGLNPAEAQEATQEVFLRLYQALSKGDEIENERAWIFRVAHNHGLNVRAKRRRTVSLEFVQLPYEAGLEQGLSDDERKRLLESALDRMSPQERQCLHLRVQGLKYREIGEAIGVGTSTVAKFLQRAVEKVRGLAKE